MNHPKAKVIALTLKQIEQLQEFYDFAKSEHSAGRTGMVVAQVGDMRFGGPGFIKVGFLRHEIAKKFTREANFNPPLRSVGKDVPK